MVFSKEIVSWVTTPFRGLRNQLIGVDCTYNQLVTNYHEPPSSVSHEVIDTCSGWHHEDSSTRQAA